jgi:hypothetical protein
VKRSEVDRAKVQIPLAVVDLGEADVLTAEDVARVDPACFYADSSRLRRFCESDRKGISRRGP